MGKARISSTMGRRTSNRCVLPPKVEFTDLVVCSVFFLGDLFRPLKKRKEP